MVRESQGVEKYQGAKVNKDAEKNFELLYSSLKFFLLAFLADYLYLHFYICSTAFVSSVITSNWKPTMVFCVNKLVRENNSFCPEKSGKMNSAE